MMLSFSLREGEILGISGLMGAGRTEVLGSHFRVVSQSMFPAGLSLMGKNKKSAA